MGWSGMKRICALSLLGLASVPVTVAAHEPTRVGTLDPLARPSGVPDDYVVTPAGLFHPSCVRTLPAGARLQDDGSLLLADGSTRRVPPCDHPRLDRSGRAMPAGPQPRYDGWVASANSDWNGTPPARELYARMSVPNGPRSQVGQVLYYFPGLEDSNASQTTILQPVLAWNGFADRRWTVTNWNCCKQGNIWHGSTIAAQTGQSIRTETKGSQCSGGVCRSWRIVSTNAHTGQSTTFNTDGYNQSFDWYFAGAKEAYGVSSCAHYPSNGAIDFSDVHVFDTAGNETTPARWNETVYTSSPACAYQVGATQFATRISWRTSR